jgi:hypothetical protein
MSKEDFFNAVAVLTQFIEAADSEKHETIITEEEV